MAAWSESRREGSIVEREGGRMDVVEEDAARASQEDFSASSLLSN